MKEENGNQDVGATAFDYPSNIAPANYNDINHKHLHVPKPTNSIAKETPHQKVMEQVLYAK